jgi:hypothetical protein
LKAIDCQLWSAPGSWELGLPVFDWPASFCINAARPSDWREVLSGDQLSSFAVDDVEKPIFVRLDQDFARDTVDREVSQDELLLPGSTVITLQICLPVRASSDTSRPSKVPT